MVGDHVTPHSILHPASTSIVLLLWIPTSGGSGGGGGGGGSQSLRSVQYLLSSLVAYGICRTFKFEFE